jgi:hypothetical protein
MSHSTPKICSLKAQNGIKEVYIIDKANGSDIIGRESHKLSQKWDN